jgi:aspartyl-tRNA(Asn)/glutamyl-tRNA(Gln) amidotransferase subunit A
MHPSVSGLAHVYPPKSRAGFFSRSFTTSYARSANFHADHVRPLNESTNALVSFSTEENPNPRGPLSSLTVAVKDNICTTALPTTCSSGMLRRMSNIAVYDHFLIQLQTSLRHSTRQQWNF